MTAPLLSVIIRTYNSQTTLDRALKSVAAQTLSPEQLETIVIDDGSADETLTKIKASTLPLILIETGHVGAIKALNLGLNRAQGRYYTILDADDELPPEALSSLLTAIQDQPTTVGIYDNYREIFTTTDTKVEVDTSHNIFTTIAGGIIFERQKVLELGGNDESLFFPEYDVLIKLQAKYQLAHLDSLVYHYYRHPGSLTANRDKVKVGITQLEEKYGYSFPIRNY